MSTDKSPPGDPQDQPGQAQPQWQPQPSQQVWGQPQQYAPQPGFTPAPQRTRKPLPRGIKILGAIVYSAALLGIGAAIGSAGSKTTPPATASTTTTQNSPAAPTTAATTATTQPAAAAAPAHHVLIRFAGSGIRNSAPFNVGSGPLTVTLFGYR